MSRASPRGNHWANQRERGSFALMKLTVGVVRLLGRRAMTPLLYLIVLYFYLFGRNAVCKSCIAFATEVVAGYDKNFEFLCPFAKFVCISGG